MEYLKYIAGQEHVAFDDESLNLIAQKADGGMRDALSMFDKAVSFCGDRLEYKQVARTLNVLDYDTYFDITAMLLAGDYARALIAFDEVLSRGFSGQTFMAGLNRHMRDLLMARQPETLRLIEMTGTLLERYRAQAGACDTEFLFGAISLLTELDGKIRQSSNQRLLVELGLMKIAKLGQKKNNGALTAEHYPLPSLDRSEAATGAAAGSAAASAAPRVPAAADTPRMAQPAREPDSAPAHTTAAGAAPRQPQPPQDPPASGRSSESAAPHGTTTAGAAPRPAARPAHTPLISGASIAALMHAPATAAPAGNERQATAAPAPEIDPACADKLEQARDRLLELIRQRRPRFVPAFERMSFRGNTIAVSVPTEELREEILRNKTGMLMRFAEIAGTTGAMELEVTVNEQIKAARPIKLEDRIRYLTEKNPLLTELRKALDLEVE